MDYKRLIRVTDAKLDGGSELKIVSSKKCDDGSVDVIARKPLFWWDINYFDVDDHSLVGDLGYEFTEKESTKNSDTLEDNIDGVKYTIDESEQTDGDIVIYEIHRAVFECEGNVDGGSDDTNLAHKNIAELQGDIDRARAKGDEAKAKEYESWMKGWSDRLAESEKYSGSSLLHQVEEEVWDDETSKMVEGTDKTVYRIAVCSKEDARKYGLHSLVGRINEYYTGDGGEDW